MTSLSVFMSLISNRFVDWVSLDAEGASGEMVTVWDKRVI